MIQKAAVTVILAAALWPAAAAGQPGPGLQVISLVGKARLGGQPATGPGQVVRERQGLAWRKR